jgi:D-3-phosphoglycerate dehydrogenase
VFIPEVEDPKSLEKLQGIADVKVGAQVSSYSEEELAGEMVDVDVVVITSQHRITRRVIDRAPKLRGIVKYGSKPGSDNVDMVAANERKILVAYTEGANADSVAEFTVTLALALAKRLPNAISPVKEHMWRDSSCMGLELAEKTAGILGLGVIGSKVAKKLGGLDMRVIARDPYVSAEKANLMHVKLVDLNTLLHESDVVTIHAKLTDETKHMIGKSQLALMKRTAYLINTARGALTDEKALYEALRDSKIAGAALDVFEMEPPSPNNPLLTLDNVILTPHIASWTDDALRKEASMAMDEVRRILTGSRPMNLANPEALS